MSNEIVKNSVIEDIIETNRICKELMSTPHYKKLGEAGMRLIVEKAKSMGMHPVDALNGGLYNVSGKIEMTGQSMLSMIRQSGHSVIKDQKSTPTKVILHGKRKDTGDSWTVSFSIEDAKKAGIYRNMWEKYPEVMCTWRCVSMLGRFLFSDIIKGVYVEGEIKESDDLEVIDPIIDTSTIDVQVIDSIDSSNTETEETIQEEQPKSVPRITQEQYTQLDEYLMDNPGLKENLVTYMKGKHGVSDLKEMPITMFKSALSRAKEQFEQKLQLYVEEQEGIYEA